MDGKNESREREEDGVVPSPVQPVVLLLHIAECQDGHGELAEDEGDPAGVGQVAPVGAAVLHQLAGVVTETSQT